MDYILSQKHSSKYCCSVCDYYTQRKNDYDKHLLTMKHKRKQCEFSKLEQGLTRKFQCNCGKKYNYRQGLFKHKKKCSLNNVTKIHYQVQECKTYETPEKNDKPKKKLIPLSLKRTVWNKYIGITIGQTVCLCCKLTDISQMSFACGHIISEYNGGEIKLDNLKPICMSCNSSMGTQNMDDFIEEYGL